ncbi:DNA-directed RNA polymerase II subunit RPB9, putative, partial [Plasmodium malariae]
EDIYIHPETKNDPALGRVRDWTCKQCGNNEAVFLQLPEKISYNPMALIYVCTDKHCHYWEKEIQPMSEDQLYNRSDLSTDSSEERELRTFVKQEIGVEVDEKEGNKKKRKKLKKVNADNGEEIKEAEQEDGDKNENVDEDEDEEKKEENRLKQELYNIIKTNEKEHNEHIDIKEENESDVDEYFCE